MFIALEHLRATLHTLSPWDLTQFLRKEGQTINFTEGVHDLPCYGGEGNWDPTCAPDPRLCAECLTNVVNSSLSHATYEVTSATMPGNSYHSYST